MLESPSTLQYGTPTPRPESERNLAAQAWRSLSSIAGALIGLALVLLIFGVWRPHQFLSSRNLNNILMYNYHYVVAAIGATFVIITAGIDLSVGSTIAFASVACAMAARGFQLSAFDWQEDLTISGGAGLLVGICVGGQLLQRGGRRWPTLLAASLSAIGTGVLVGNGWAVVAGRSIGPSPAWIAIAVGIGAGGLIGLINGALITTISLPPFIVTLGTLEAVRGVTLDITGSMPVSRLPPSFIHELHSGRWLGLPPNVWIAMGLVIVSVPVLHYTVLGRYTYAIGSSERTARLCGVRVERWKTIVYIIAGLTAGLAGVMMTSQFDSGQPTEFVGLELTVIAAVVIGGTSLFGGEGTVIGSVIGVLMLAFLHSGCNIAAIPSERQRVFIGGMIIVAAALDRFRHLLR